MKTVFLIALTALSMGALAEDKWLTIAQTIDCGEQISVKAKEGVPFVLIGLEKLPSKEGKIEFNLMG